MMTDKRVLRNFVDGAAIEPADGRYADLIDPSTGEVFAAAPVSSEADVDRAMRAAEKAFEAWRETTPSDRQRALLKLALAVEARADELVAAECQNTGKPIALTASEELPPAIDQIRFFAGAARVLEGRSAGEYLAGHTSYVRCGPIGVCAQVTPWNYPLMMAVWKFGPASSVWTRDHGRAMRMTRRLDFGCVWVNTHIPLVAEMPHGGFKHSGYGKDLSMYGLEDYNRIKHVMHNIEG
jgi:betaine-aldehyde dehydrogenase